MASITFTDYASSATARLLPFTGTNFRSNGVVFFRRLVNPLSVRTTSFRSLTIRSSSTSPPVVTAAMGSEAVAKVIDGKLVTKKIREEITAEVSKMKDEIGVVPGLAVILVGERKDSATYHMNEQKILNAVSIEKDVDGFHPLNIGRLAMRGREPLFVPCTPKGCIELLHRYGVEIKGKRAAVIGRSNIVGMPAALLLQREDATISIVHSRTKNPEEITRQADIIIAAVGQPNMVKGNWIKPGAVIIDVGINPVEDSKSARGYRLVGDVCYEEACKVASAITPVPGGVGPMTIAMLLSNTLSSAKRINNLQ
ncbi:bifunctional protein FolD 4, chloroplastic-like isoform X3 [Euphorbia lathyris]|uniref:bifunctional protein FolD 4, chloroplastic-like isoform X3 n=1 Tax=Euphorbia lathyris TaxID=212925 RepID=UPI0033141F61